MGHPRPLLVYFGTFHTIYRIKIVDFSGIRTRIVGVESEHTDHLTTTTAQFFQVAETSFTLLKPMILTKAVIQ